MKNIYLSLIFLSFFLSGYSQTAITIDKSDFPKMNDTLRFSGSNLTAPFSASQTGADYTWDYSTLVAKNQSIDTFIHPLASPFAYNLTFTNPIIYPNNVANLASPSKAPTPPASSGITISEMYDFFRSNNSSYTYVGFASQINGIPTATVISPPDVMYHFPVNFGDKDSSSSEYIINLPTLVYYKQKLKRVNTVDGWGKLKTPYGTFDVLRVKTMLYYVDSIKLDQLLFPISLHRTEIEYKWIGKGHGLPLLLVSGRMGGGPGGGGSGFNVNKVEFRDMYKSFTGIDEDTNGDKFSVYPVPAIDNFTVEFSLKNNVDVTFELFDPFGRLVQLNVYKGLAAGTNKVQFNFEGESLSPAIYFLRFTSGEETYTRRLNLIGN